MWVAKRDKFFPAPKHTRIGKAVDLLLLRALKWITSYNRVWEALGAETNYVLS
jgi:hypothetical protein